MPTLDCLHKHIFLLYVYSSVSLARMRRYTQLAYLFHQCAKSLLSRDCRIAGCTVRHLGVERPFSSYIFKNLQKYWYSHLWVKKKFLQFIWSTPYLSKCKTLCTVFCFHVCAYDNIQHFF